MQVDKGAIKHVFTGANIMCPGLTSKGNYQYSHNWSHIIGGKMDDMEADKVVVYTYSLETLDLNIYRLLLLKVK